MNRITILTADPKQTLKLILDDGSKVNVKLRYSETQEGWYLDIDRGDFIIKGRRIVVSPNLLRAFRDIIPFGVACFSTDGYEPVLINDFTSGRVKLYLLNAEDIVTAEQGIAAYE